MQPEIRKASLGPVFLAGVFWFLAFALVVGIFFCLTHSQDTYDSDRAAERLKNLADLKKTEEAKLTGTAWVDKAKGLARLPIEQAMQQESVMLLAKPVEASTVKVDDPYPAGLANLKLDNELAAAASPSPAASAKP